MEEAEFHEILDVLYIANRPMTLDQISVELLEESIEAQRYIKEALNDKEYRDIITKIILFEEVNPHERYDEYTGEIEHKFEKNILMTYYCLTDVCYGLYFKIMRSKLKEERKPLNISALEYRVGESIKNYYQLQYKGSSNFFCLLDIDFQKILDLNPNIFYTQKSKIGLIEWLDESEINSHDKLEILKTINKILRNEKTSQLTIEELTLKVNISDTETFTKKPYDESLIRDILISNPERFVVEHIGNLISLRDEKTYFKKYFEKETFSYDEIKDKEFNNNDTIIAFKFVGNDFPIKEAVEYVKVRPIVYISRPKVVRMLRNNIGKSEFIKNLKFFIEEDSIKKWTEQNIRFSIYEEYSSEIDKLYPQLIEEFSPVFNVKDNPGNLFSELFEMIEQ